MLDSLLARVASGTETLVIARSEGQLVGFAVLAMDESPLRRHWATVKRVQIRPELQGRGVGALLMQGVHDVARRMGMTNAASRAVGLANGRNPIPIVIPCHRVIGADGSLTGYGGGVERKQALLALEQDTLF